jgi:hypothetical protein
MKQPIFINKAVYVSDLIVELSFNDGNIKKVNFEPFFSKHSHPQYDKYQKKSNFKKFFIEKGNIVWGKNWDLIFPIEMLYKGQYE